MNFSAQNSGVQRDAVVPHSTTDAHRIAPDLSLGAACFSQTAACICPATAIVNPLDARRASLALSQPRLSVPESEAAEQDFLSGIRGHQD